MIKKLLQKLVSKETAGMKLKIELLGKKVEDLKHIVYYLQDTSIIASGEKPFEVQYNKLRIADVFNKPTVIYTTETIRKIFAETGITNKTLAGLLQVNPSGLSQLYGGKRKTLKSPVRVEVTNRPIFNNIAHLYKEAVYFGHISPNTREFCRRLLGNRQLYTAQEIRRMSNGQGIPVIRYCGGYRCMHEWMWIDEEWGEVSDLLKAA